MVEPKTEESAGKMRPDATGVRKPELEPTDGEDVSSGGIRRLNKKVIVAIAGVVSVAFLGFVAMQMFSSDDVAEKGEASEEANVSASEDGAASIDSLENESQASAGKKPADQEAKLQKEAAESKKMKEAEAMQAAMEKRVAQKEEEAEEEGDEKDPWKEARKGARRQHAQRFHKQALAADTGAVFAKLEEVEGGGSSKASVGSDRMGSSDSRQAAFDAKLERARLRAQQQVQTGGVRGSGASGGQSQKQEFLKQAGNDESSANVHRLQAPLSEYVVQAGTVLPLVLETGISSDLPGYLRARVSRPVYDTPTGEHLLIPAGAYVVGRYNSQVEFGDARVQVVWTRLLLPNGHSLKLGGIPGVDLSGKTGVKDKVDYHWDRLIAGAALSTGLAAGAGAAAGPRGGLQEETPGQTALSAAGENVSEVGEEIVKRELGVQPTLEIRPGMEMAALVHEDLVLEPYVTEFN